MSFANITLLFFALVITYFGKAILADSMIPEWLCLTIFFSGIALLVYVLHWGIL